MSKDKWSLKYLFVTFQHRGPAGLNQPGRLFLALRSGDAVSPDPGQKEQKPARFLCLREPKKAGQRNLRVALGAARPQCGRAAPGRAPTCADRRRERKPPAAGTNPMTSCPSKRDPLVAPLLSSSVEGLKRFGSLLATPFRPPQGKPPFILPAR